MKDDRSTAEIEFWRSASINVKMEAMQCLFEVTREIIAKDLRLQYPKWTKKRIEKEVASVILISRSEELEFMARYPRYIGNVRRN